MDPGPAITLLGAGGHALVVAQAARLGGIPINGAHDDDPDAPLLSGGDAPKHLGSLAALAGQTPHRWVLALGDLGARRAWIDALDGSRAAGPVVHPDAFVAPDATLGPGVFVGPGAVVHTRAAIGAHAIINSGAIVEHECVVGINAHIGPGGVVCGRVRIGADTLVGAGSSLIPCLTVGAGVTIGAGSVVVRDIPDRVTAMGSPARVAARSDR